MYFPYYGSECELGTATMGAQADAFSVEGMGVPITEELLNTIKDTTNGTEYPILLPNTEQYDLAQANYVLSKPSCLYSDLGPGPIMKRKKGIAG